MSKDVISSGPTARNFSPAYDVSIILNLHNEARYLIRTLLSLEEAVRYGRQFDITFEIVVVLDNADRATTELASAYDYGAFDGVNILHVTNRSLGLSRNDGARVARGEYVAMADGDDLISFDFLQRMYMTATSSPKKSIMFPEYIVGFGESSYIWKFYGKKYVDTHVFFEHHPYISRIFCHREVFEEIIYSDASPRSGFAYEDWHFNCECIVAGYSVVIAKGSVLFYRQRHGSLLRQANGGILPMIPASRFFQPNTYLKLTWSEFAGERKTVAPQEILTVQNFILAPGMTEILAAANNIDPAVNMWLLMTSHIGSNLTKPGPAAEAYFNLCRAVAGLHFTDVVLLPFLTTGGAEKFILSVTHALCEAEPGSRVLFLAGQPFKKHEWLDKLPEGSLFVDLPSLTNPPLGMDDALLITFRLLQNLRCVKRIHVKGSEFGDKFLKSHARRLENILIYFYYFCDEVADYFGIQYVNGYAFDLISDIGEFIHGIISDHSKNIEMAVERIGPSIATKTHTLYTVKEANDHAASRSAKPQHRLLWASRIDGQKRPNLVPLIAQLLAEKIPGVTIEAFGTTTYGEIDKEVFGSHPNLVYMGSFSNFDDLQIGTYDALLYTAAFDGLPNIVLEAVATGLPVIAPNIGGIHEVVNAETGYLIENVTSDRGIVELYVEAISDIYKNWPTANVRAARALELLNRQHSKSAYLDKIRQIFGLSLK